MELVPIEKLSKMLKKKRQRNGIKQKKAASAAGMSPSHVNRIENNTTNPSYRSVYKLWKTLDQLENREIKTAEDLMNSPVETVSKNVTLEEVAVKMRENDFSQLPVVENGESIGRITETRIINSGDPDQKVEEVMDSQLMEVQPSTPKTVVREILKNEPAVLVTENSEIKGIIAKADLL